MSTFDLQNIWHSDQDKAKAHYESLSNVEKMARKQSGDILRKLYRYILMETIVSFVIVILVGVMFFGKGPWILAGYIVFMAGLMYIAWREFYSFYKSMRRVNTQTVLNALCEYERLIAYYIRRNKILVDYVVPLGYAVGFFLGIYEEHEIESLQEILIPAGIGLGVGIVFVLLFRFAVRKYINWAYGGYLRRFRDVRKNLEAEETSE